MEKKLYKRIRGNISDNYCQHCLEETDLSSSDIVFELTSGSCALCKTKKRNLFEGVEIKEIYKIREPNKEIFICKDCLLEKENHNQCRQATTGICAICGYERDKKVIAAEKLKFIRWNIEEIKRIIENVEKTNRKIKIETLIFERERFLDDFQNLSDPLSIKNRMHIPFEIKKPLLLDILKEKISDLEEEEEDLLQKIKTPV